MVGCFKLGASIWHFFAAAEADTKLGLEASWVGKLGVEGAEREGATSGFLKDVVGVLEGGFWDGLVFFL